MRLKERKESSRALTKKATAIRDREPAEAKQANSYRYQPHPPPTPPLTSSYALSPSRPLPPSSSSFHFWPFIRSASFGHRRGIRGNPSISSPRRVSWVRVAAVSGACQTSRPSRSQYLVLDSQPVLHIWCPSKSTCHHLAGSLPLCFGGLSLPGLPSFAPPDPASICLSISPGSYISSIPFRKRRTNNPKSADINQWRFAAEADTRRSSFVA